MCVRWQMGKLLFSLGRDAQRAGKISEKFVS
jgi:hypothetical protein